MKKIVLPLFFIIIIFSVLIFFSCDLFFNPFLDSVHNEADPVVIINEPSGVTNLAPSNGIVAYLPFNGNADDESENLNHGTVYGPVLAEDRFGNPQGAYYLDGANDYIEIPSNLRNLGISNAFSICIWIKSDSVSSWHNLLEDGTQFTSSCFYIVVWPQANQMGIRLNTSSSSYFNDNISVPAFREKWTLVVYTYSGSSMRFYIDGELVFSRSISGNVVNGNRNLRIGYPSGENYFKGSVDDLRIYNRALSACEIKHVYYNKQGLIFSEGELISFSCTAFDLEDGELEEDSLVWTSDIDGQIGIGKSFSKALSIGDHVITVSATDSVGNVSSSTNTVKIICAP